MYTTYNNPNLPAHNTSLVDKENPLKGGTCNYLFQYKNDWYIVKSQEGYWSRSYFISLIRNKTSNTPYTSMVIKKQVECERDFIRTLERIFNRGFDIRATIRNRNEWIDYVIPIIKRQIDAEQSK